MNDYISRQAAIEAVDKNRDTVFHNSVDYEGVLYDINNLPSAQPDQTKMIKEIREWINSGNRGNADYFNADYFIVDMIEEIINKYE